MQTAWPPLKHQHQLWGLLHLLLLALVALVVLWQRPAAVAQVLQGRAVAVVQQPQQLPTTSVR
jgi:hypothetical protein